MGTILIWLNECLVNPFNLGDNGVAEINALLSKLKKSKNGRIISGLKFASCTTFSHSSISRKKSLKRFTPAYSAAFLTLE